MIVVESVGGWMYGWELKKDRVSLGWNKQFQCVVVRVSEI
jgi:hypothetical protein